MTAKYTGDLKDYGAPIGPRLMLNVIGSPMTNYSKPPWEDLRKFGILAYVTAKRRAEIYALPAGQAKHTIRSIEADITYLKKKGKL